MSRLDLLANAYERHISAPWQRNLSGQEKLIFVVYNKEDELRFRKKIEDFRQRTLSSEHDWIGVDTTSYFTEWLAAEEYKEEYFRFPEDLELKLNDFTTHCSSLIRKELEAADENTVLALYGVGGLFGVTRLHQILEKLYADIRGRIVVFFPGSFDQNNYRLLDAREGWSYLAVPIVA